MRSATYAAVPFALDGVLTPTAALHARCWKQTFVPLRAEWGRSAGACPEPFDTDRDCLIHVDGKLRDDGVRDFLRARSTAPEAAPDRPPGKWSVEGIGRRKQALVEPASSAAGIEAFPGSIRRLRELRGAGIRTAAVSWSTNATAVLRAAGIDAHVDVTVDGRDDAERVVGETQESDTHLRQGPRRIVAEAPCGAIRRQGSRLAT
jgi:alpha,alpha-trehalose phosphorylase